MIVIGLGSNLGERAAHLARARAEIAPLFMTLTASPVYESRAVLPAGAPELWDMNFLNMAVRGESGLAPHDLLKALQNIEQKLGRAASHPVWSPREIDLDILAYHDLHVSEEGLTIPHPHLLARPFSLWPLAGIAPEWRYPVSGPDYGVTAGELAQRFSVRYPEDIFSPGNASGTWQTSVEI